MLDVNGVAKPHMVTWIAPSPGILSLPSKVVHVWTVSLASKALNALPLCLSDDEIRRASRYSFELVRSRFQSSCAVQELKSFADEPNT